MADDFPIPETRVLAVASHVTYGHVGNSMATPVLQSLGVDVAALDTVQFSNHTGYKQFKGTRTTPEELRDIFDGLQQSFLDDFDVLLSGYVPGPEAVDAVGSIARDLKLKGGMKAGSFFWVLDPVMGDQGKLYVHEDVVPAYKNLLRDADLILPNQFEAETLSDVKIDSFSTLRDAITALHQNHRVPHVVVTSVRFDLNATTLSVVGSTLRADNSPRIFKVDVPAIDCFFSGTGDMFAALMLVRLREASIASDLLGSKSWIPPDDVGPTDLPLAKAVEKVLGSMQAVLNKTKEARDRVLQDLGGELGVLDKESSSEKRVHLRKTKAAEIRLVRNWEDLRRPEVQHFAEELDV
ncbi:MAG: putative pyridoxal kinase [Piccolia ochrophora]|nr:MAG: putative pyridoxal kinase [Piccolia ochrophora]